LSRYKNILFLVTVLVVQIIGLAVQVRRPNPTSADAPAVRLIRYWAIGLMSPPEKAVHGTGTGLRGLWSNYLDLRHVRQQNQDLRDQVARLQLEQATLLEDARQGQRLQQLLAFKEHYIYTTVPTQVIGTSGTDQSRILYIDKGAKDGLKPDMAVITPDGIVGKLKDVFAHTSQVLVISDQTSGAGVLLESTRLRGVLRGNALGEPQIINMLPDDRVKPGERVITSGGDQIYPRGLPVGVVDRVVADSQNPPYLDFIIKPAANLGHLEELLVITQAADQMQEKEKQDLVQSAAEGAAVSQRRASDILAERLPGLNDPNAVVDPKESSQTAATAAAAATDAAPPKLHPLPTLHADHYSPDATPPAKELMPGQAIVDPKYAKLSSPQPQIGPAADRTNGADATDSKTTAANSAARNPDHTGDTAGQAGAVKTPVHHPVTNAEAPGTAVPGAAPGTPHPPAAKPKAPKPPPDQPVGAEPTPEPAANPPAPAADGGPSH
jgi:rod shape-determining protein MreC